MFKTLILSLSFILFSVLPAFADDSILWVTYYPAPYGAYKEMRAMRMAVGDHYVRGEQYYWDSGSGTPIDDDADLIVEGNVGIGRVDPSQKLDVNGGIAIAEGASIAPASFGHNPGHDNTITFGQAGGSWGGIKVINYFDGSYNNQYVAFDTHHGGVSAGERMRIDRDGNVGIGTTEPGQKLTVAGTIETTSGGVKFPDGTLQKSGVRVWDSGWVSVTGDARGRVQTFTHTLGAVPEFVQIWVSKTNSSAGGTMFQGDGYGSYGSGDNSACEVNKVTPTEIKIRYAKNDGGGYIVNSFDEDKQAWQIMNGNFYVRVVAMKVN